MAPNVTNYAEIQNDEIQALRSIYMEDFEEHEAKPGPWNKVVNRSFSIKLKASTSGSNDYRLDLLVSLPNTYPKSTPRITLKFGAGVRSKTKREAEELVSWKSKALLGSEMIFEIATLLQDILDHAAQSTEIPALDQERAMQIAASQQKSHAAASRNPEEEVADVGDQGGYADTDEAQALAVMVEQTKLRADMRKGKSLDKGREKNAVDWRLRFDRAMISRVPKGPIYEFDTIHNRVSYRQGPVTKVAKVYAYSQQCDVEPHLVLKESRFKTAGNAKLVKGLMLDLEERLERLSKMRDDPNVFKPLGYTIKRSADDNNEEEDEWYVGIIVGLASRGSMQDVLDTVAIIVPETFRAWALQLLEGLQFLHRNRVPHSRIHLGNILLEKSDAGNVVAKLADGHFQHALHVLRFNGLDNSQKPTSSAGWIPPEATRGLGVEALLPTDVWDLGICFSQMLFGLGVRGAHASPKELIKDLELSSSLEELLIKLFKPDFKQRATAFDLLPAAFLRNEDPVFMQRLGIATVPKGSSNHPITSETTGRRRESIAAPATSRYRTDFVEAGRLGRGGFGEVVRSRNKLDGRFYAVKKIKSKSAAALNDVLSEIMILSQINHPYVVRYYNAWLESERPRKDDFDRQSDYIKALSSSEAEDSHLGPIPSGLDFMSQSGPDVDVVFESDSDEDTNLEDSGENLGRAAERAIGHFSHERLEYDCVSTEEDENNLGSDATDDAQSQRNSDTKAYPIHSTLYIQMEYCERKTLRDLIIAEIHTDSVESWRIFRQILEGLAHIHTLSIVHRDLKPENIFIDAENDVRIGDFGLARHGDYQPSVQPTNIEEAYTSFTKSIGTTFYVAPEVRSAGRGKYNEKADMYSLGVIFFEMCIPMMTGMERADTLRRLREEEYVLPPIFKLPEKSTQGSIVASLINHDPSHRPSSSQLLASEQIPGEVENDKWTRDVLRRINEGSYRKKLLESLFQKPDEIEMSRSRLDDIHQTRLAQSNLADPDDDRDFYPRLRPQELTYDTRDRSNSADELLLRNLVKEKVAWIFRRHGAVPIDKPTIVPFSSHYLRKYDQIVKLLSSDDDFLQLPFDYTLPNARLLAKAAKSPRKTYTFGEVYRNVEGSSPRRISEADFDIVSYDSLDLAVREAEVMKTVDEIINEFPSMASIPMCYYINHSRLFNAILAYCKVHPSKWAIVKDTLGTLQGGQSNWSKIRATLRSPAIGVAATSVEELMRFDFKESYDKAIPRLRALLNNETLEPVFAHVKDLTTYLRGYGLSRKVFVSPLSSVNENFYRGQLFFQCIFDTPKREVFAAGGRYDHLIRAQTSGKLARGEPRAVGFNFNWERLWMSMARYYKANAKVKPRRKSNVEALKLRIPSRCEVLVDSSDREILRSAGLDIIQGLWANDISAELIIDTDTDEANSIYNSTNESKGSHGWIVFIKQDSSLRVRSVAKKEESELRASELLVWLRNEIRERDRSEGRTSIARIPRASSYHDSGPSAGELDVRIITSSSKGKKFNRKSVLEEANTVMRETVNGFLECPLVAIETKDEIFERIRDTRLSDPESWKRFIQNTPADDRAYLKNLQECLRDMAKEHPELNGGFIYNFRTRSCVYYDLG